MFLREKHQRNVEHKHFLCLIQCVCVCVDMLTGMWRNHLHVDNVI